MSSETCPILHRKSANEPAIKEAVKQVRSKGIDLDVRIPWNKKAKTGVLPLGTANDFAHGLGLPCDDLKQCLEIACTVPAKAIDVGRANERSFINVTSGGFEVAPMAKLDDGLLDKEIDMALHDNNSIRHKMDEDVYASSDLSRRLPKYRIPDTERDTQHAYVSVHDELMLDGNARQNLATFCQTWSEPAVRLLMVECIDKNMVDKDEYPQTAEIEARCVHMLADLWNSPEDANPAT